MKRSGPDLKRRLPEPERCSTCKGAGVNMGIFHEIECQDCIGIGWLPVAGADLTQQLGAALTKTYALNRLMSARLEEFSGPQAQYQDNKKDGHRGHYTGD